MIVAQRRFLGATGEQWALIVALPLNQAANSALYTVLGPFRAEFGLSYVAMGAVLATYGLARFVMDVPAGVLIRRVPLRLALLVGLFVNLVSAAGSIASTAVWQIVAARTVQGVSSSVVQAGILAWLIIGAHSGVRGRVMALSEALFSTVGLIVPLGTGALALAFGWRAAFATATITGFLACLAVLFGTDAASAPKTTAPEAEPGSARASVWSSISSGGGMLLAAYLLAFIVAFSRLGMVNTLVPVIGSDQLGLSPIQVGLGLTLANVVGIVMLMSGGWAGDRFGRRRLAAPGVMLLLLCQCALFFIVDQRLFFVIVAAQGLGYFMNSFSTSLVGDALPPHLRSIGIAGYRLVVDAAVLLAPVVVGAIADWRGFDAAKALTLAVTIVVLAVVWIAARAKEPHVHPAEIPSP